MNRFALLLVLVLSQAAATAGQVPDPADPVFAMTRLAEGVWAAEVVSRPPYYAFANSLVVIGGDGVLIVDAQASRAATRALLQEVRRRTDAPVRWLINTHHHGDHVYGNVVYREAFPRLEIIGHLSLLDDVPGAAAAARERELAELPAFIETRREWLRTGVGPSGDALSEADRASVTRSVALRQGQLEDLGGTELVPPTMAFERRMELRVGERRIVLLHPGPAHTRGDVVVHLPDDGILAVGDLLEAGLPYLADDSDVAGWASALDQIAALAPTAILPAHGRTLRDHALLDAQRSLFGFSARADTSCGGDGRVEPSSMFEQLRARYEHVVAGSGETLGKWVCAAVVRRGSVE